MLIRSDLRDVLVSVALSHALKKRLHINLGFSLVYNFLAIPIAAGALYVVIYVIFTYRFPVWEWVPPPWMAGGLMAMSSVTGMP